VLEQLKQLVSEVNTNISTLSSILDKILLISVLSDSESTLSGLASLHPAINKVPIIIKLAITNFILFSITSPLTSPCHQKCFLLQLPLHLPQLLFAEIHWIQMLHHQQHMLHPH